MCQNTCRNAFLNHGNFCNLTQYSSLDDKSSVLSKNMWFCCSKHTKPWGSSFKLLEKWMSKFLMPWSSIHNTGGFSRLSFWLRIETKTRSANSNRLYNKKLLLLMLSKHRAQKTFNQRGPAPSRYFLQIEIHQWFSIFSIRRCRLWSMPESTCLKRSSERLELLLLVDQRQNFLSILLKRTNSCQKE